MIKKILKINKTKDYILIKTVRIIFSHRFLVCNVFCSPLDINDLSFTLGININLGQQQKLNTSKQ